MWLFPQNNDPYMIPHFLYINKIRGLLYFRSKTNIKRGVILKVRFAEVHIMMLSEYSDKLCAPFSNQQHLRLLT